MAPFIWAWNSRRCLCMTMFWIREVNSDQLTGNGTLPLSELNYGMPVCGLTSIIRARRHSFSFAWKTTARLMLHHVRHDDIQYRFQRSTYPVPHYTRPTHATYKNRSISNHTRYIVYPANISTSKFGKFNNGIHTFRKTSKYLIK